MRGLLPGVGSDGGCDPEPFGEVRAGAHPCEVRARADSARGLPHHDVLERPVSSGIMLNVTQYGNVVWFRKSTRLNVVVLRPVFHSSVIRIKKFNKELS